MIATAFYILVMTVAGSAWILGLPYMPHPAKMTTGVIYVIAFAIWGGVLIDTVLSTIKKQIENFFSLDKIKLKKDSYEKELEEYKEEMKEVLIERYKEFEEAMMQKVTDSKLLATLLQQSGYSGIIKTYNSKIERSLEKINLCDRERLNIIQAMEERQNDIYGYGLFIPKKYHY